MIRVGRYFFTKTMKKFICFFLLITFLCYGSGFASSSRINIGTREGVTKMDPKRFTDLSRTNTTSIRKVVIKMDGPKKIC